MQAAHYSNLLPEPLRHRSTRVRIFQPQIILIDFHGTICERRWEDKVINPYILKALPNFMRENLALEAVQKCLPGLKNESFEMRFRHKYEDAPIIEDTVEDHTIEPSQLADQMSEFLLWQIQNRHEIQETRTITRLVWIDGFRRQMIQTPIFDDVLQSVTTWRDKYGCSIHVISSIDAETLKLLLENTTKGNLAQYLSGYVSAKKTGDKLISEIYKQFCDKLSVVPRQPRKRHQSSSSITRQRESTPEIATDNNGQQTRPPSNNSNPVTHKSVESLSNSKANSNSLISAKSTDSTLSSVESSQFSRPVMFLTDSGQEAKAASQVGNGQLIECLLVNRPGNKRIRTYYLSQFPFIESFNDIEFVEKKA